MIVDCHTRIWASPDQLGAASARWLARDGGRDNLSADPGDHAASAREVTRTLIWGFRSRHLGADVPNSFLADYVSQHRGHAVGIAAVDPLEPDAMERLANIAQRGEFAGITLSPAAQAFHPAHSLAMGVYEFCARRQMPLFVETGTDFGPQAVIEFARPHLLDEVARTFPELTIVISAMGSPWVAETVALLAKQPRVYADLAGLLRRPWEAYHTLLLAYQRGVAEKLLFGSDFPFLTAAEAIGQIYRTNEVTRGTSMPTIPRETLRSIVERNALAELGIA
ncbi:MAG TPA: amidohydrolase family protein [Phycisphaerae bacterium]|nr:amidohydrolase family protein [Phycisphaerae bacterium]HUU21185.1 amidohydrolase family protein [Phycisphaerae bacterium]